MSDCVLTVSIATYNVEKYLNETLDSFIDTGIETGKIEVLIVNDGSTDSSLTIAKEYETKYPLTFRIINKENGGWGSTVNAGIQFAKGKYFKLLDGDDYFFKDNLKEFVEFISNTDSDLIVTPFDSFCNNDGMVLEHFEYVGLKENEQRFMNEFIDKLYPLRMHAACVKTDLLKEKVVITENCFYTDAEFVVKAVSLCNTISYYDKTIYMYRVDRAGQSMSVDGFRKHYTEHEKIIFVLLAYYNCNELDPRMMLIIKKQIITMIQTHYGILMLLGDKKDEIELFDEAIREATTMYYDVTSIKIRMLRATHFKIYGVMSKIQKMQVNL